MASPLYAQNPVIGQVKITTANTNVDGSGTLGTVVTGAAAPGTQIDLVSVFAEVTTGDGWIIFVLDDGVTKVVIPPFLIVPAYTANPPFRSPWSGVWVPAQKLVLPSASYILKAGTYLGTQFALSARGVKFA